MCSLGNYHRCLSRWLTVGVCEHFYWPLLGRMLGDVSQIKSGSICSGVFSRVPGCVVHVVSMRYFATQLEREWIGMVFDQCEERHSWVLFGQWVCRLFKQDYHSWYFGINVGDVSNVDSRRDLFAELVSQIEGVFTLMLLVELWTLLFNLPFWSLRLYLST